MKISPPNRLVLTYTISFLIAWGAQIASSYHLIKYYSEDMVKLVEKTHREYMEFDRTHICAILDCKQVLIFDSNLSTQKSFTYNEYNLILNPDNSNVNDSYTLKISNNTAVSLPSFDFIVIFMKGINTAFVIECPRTIKFVFYTSTVLGVFTIIIFVITTLLSLARAKDSIKHDFFIKNIKATEEVLMNMNRALSHRLKSPMSIIISEINQLNKVNELDMDFEVTKKGFRESLHLIDASIKDVSQIMNCLSEVGLISGRASGKNLYDLIQQSYKMVKISAVENFNVSISNELLQYKSSQLRAEDMRNIFYTHIKNSVEAMATEIIFDINKYDTRTGLMEIIIEDNGKGIPKEAQDSIYEEGFTTKASYTRESFSLYLSKSLLKELGGNGEYLYKSDNLGTIFVIQLYVSKS